MGKKLKVGISVGDINGIGLEVIIKTFSDPRMLDLCTPVVYASGKVGNFHRKAAGVEDFSFNLIQDASKANDKRVNLVECWKDEVHVMLGENNAQGGEYAYQSLMGAIEDIASNKVDVLVTAPINKHNMPRDKFKFAGHTEFLADYANAENPLMILCSDDLRVACVTGHIPLKDVPAVLTEEKVHAKIIALEHSLRNDFGIDRPKIAVLGLNPHSGDNGLIGKEEQDVIIPAIKAAKAKKILAWGPYAADGFFGSSNHQNFDAILSMYHDQGLTGFKALSFGSGVNYTAGLPIVRTSPDHGTGYDIAGKQEAGEGSFRNAVYLAIDVYKTRSLERTLAANKLEPQMK